MKSIAFLLLFTLWAPARPPEAIWDALFLDLLEKYDAASSGASFARVKLIPYATRYAQPLSALTSPEAARFWHEKYGVFDAPLFQTLDPSTAGSYRNRGPLHFTTQAPRLPPEFNPAAPSSLQNLDAYLKRKWGGLDSLAAPDRILFSELGTHDTLGGLRALGYAEFYLVNGAYAMRGSKTLLAFTAKGGNPLLVFHSFIGRDLFDHKLMQLALQFGERFPQIQILSSNNLKSWDVAKLVVERALRTAQPGPIDDLVIGYADRVDKNLARRGRLLYETRLGDLSTQNDFATLKIYSLRGKNGLERHVAILTDVDLRYFGDSALLLVKPFLQRGVDRIIFSGSAGCLDAEVPLHAVVVPRSFSNLGAGRVPLENDLYGLLPFGVGYSGKHLSLLSPLIESTELVTELRDREKILTLDVEGAKIARVIAEWNVAHGTRVRYASAFIVTDTPVAQGETPKGSYGLHNPDFRAKEKAKALYVAALNLLWDLPDQFLPSNHTKLIGRYYAGDIRALVENGDHIGLAWMYSDIVARLSEVSALAEKDQRASRGLAKTYRDLLRELEKLGVSGIERETAPLFPEFAPLRPLPPAHQRALLLESLTRSSTLNSGEVVYAAGETPESVRARALAAAANGVDWVLAQTGPLTRDALTDLHRMVNVGVLPAEKLGRIRAFEYRPVDGAPVSSAGVFDAFLGWLAHTPPSTAAALEAFLRFEQLHPFADGNGRVAELIAQSVALRAGAHPLLFPHRFDIDYILSLKRNGSHSESTYRYVEGVLDLSARFGDWLRGENIAGSALDPATGQVVLTLADGKRRFVRAAFESGKTIPLERETREFVAPGEAFLGSPDLVGRLEHARTEYTVVYGLMARPCNAVLKALVE